MPSISATSTEVSLRIPASDLADSVLKPSTQTREQVRTVLIVKSALEQYRLPFFRGLQKRLAEENIQLRVAVPKQRCSTYSESWLVPVSGGDFHLLGRTLSWQGIRSCARGANLIIMQQCARELSNYWLLRSRKAYGYRLALWGHGTDFQPAFTSPVARYIKRRVFSKVDFWFAYTPGVARIVAGQGYPTERICTTFNSVNTTDEIAYHRAVTEENIRTLRAELGMRSEAKLFAYCGTLYKAKRLDFLIEACRVVRSKGVDLHLAVIGDGADRSALESLYRAEAWIHFVGPAYAEKKAMLLAAAECMTIPGVIGLAIVDSFAHECPLITTSAPGHGPEIEYLVDGSNGVRTNDNLDDYSRSLHRLLTDPHFQRQLRLSCRETAKEITMERMIDQFAAGIVKAMRLPNLW